jgi:YD repeat-containing protein
MKKVLQTAVVLMAISGLSLMTSCKKTAAVNGQVKTETSVNNGNSTTTVYTYDSQGRQIVSSGGVSYAYSQSTVTQTNTTGTPIIYTLNNQGYAASDNNGETYSYDNNGYLTTAVLGANSESFTISNGDQVSATFVINGVTTTYTVSYLSNVDYRDYGLKFLGKNSTHVLNTIVKTSGGASTTTTYSYNYDSQGRVVTQTATDSNGNVTTTTYTYTS